MKAAGTDRRRLLLAAGLLAASGAASAQERPAARSAAGLGEQITPAVTAPLSAFISGAQTASWPDDVSELARRHLLDTVASIIACHDLAPAVVARRYVLAQNPAAAGGQSIWGGPERAPLAEAVFANAMAGHGAEINDYSPSAFVQPGPSVVSVALGVAASRGLTGRAALRSIIVGYELACRVPKALGVKNLRLSGLANHGVGPTFGSAAAAASLIGLPQVRIPDLLSYCAEQASGSWQWLLDTDHIEKAFVFAGMGAQRGLQSALMVEAGFTGVRDSLDRRGGWLDSGQFNGPGGDLDRSYLIEGLGTRFELPLVGYKRYAAGGPTQAGVQGLLTLIRTVDRRQVRHVRIEMPGVDLDAFRAAAMPALNLPYMCALILRDGRLDFVEAQSRARMADASLQAAMRQVELAYDPTQDRQPRVESARVTVTLDDGSTKSVFIDGVDGFPTKPLSHADVEAKARELLTPRLGPQRTDEVVERVWTIDRAPKVDGLIAALSRNGRQG